eukprot:1779688-Karenia_brevis.AAC.1
MMLILFIHGDNYHGDADDAAAADDDYLDHNGVEDDLIDIVNAHGNKIWNGSTDGVVVWAVGLRELSTLPIDICRCPVQKRLHPPVLFRLQ